ncbi:hypothetical protein MERGE_002633 [Pneumocystis wakefieldiae]|uniref:Small-subunit processome Utp21 domain-containing protein n=1 Tax=Pneumocystis wakefieldiae TaxID=38082 RepID=A0A899FXH6_9ASCO|nr:hypothetical protein MERGE_002633 [Pneumocystis wakefieldiae]
MLEEMGAVTESMAQTGRNRLRKQGKAAVWALNGTIDEIKRREALVHANMSGFEKKRDSKHLKLGPESGHKDESENMQSSYLFSPFRTIGYVCSNVPFDVMARGGAFLVSLSVGRNIQTYDVRERISSVCSWGDFVFAGAGQSIFAYRKGKIEWSIRNEEGEGVLLMCVYGGYLVTYTEKNSLVVWNILTREFGRNEGVLCMIHPATYLNKFILGKKDGILELWNIRTGKLIYQFSSFKLSITCLEQPPVLDIIAVGLASGVISMYDIRKDQELFQFKQDGSVTSIGFRTDGPPMMCSSNDNGDIFIWDLSKRRILNQWIFDSPDSIPRLLKHRSGHSAPPSIIRFYQDDSHFILSASRDRSLRGFSIFNDSQNTELSQKPFIKKPISLNFSLEELRLPEILSFAAQPTKEKYWNNIITAHKGENVARLWSWRRKAIEKFVLKTSDKSSIKKEITGIVSDSLNKTLVSSSLDGTIKFWKISTGKLMYTLDIKLPITLMRYQKSSDLLAIVCDDFCIRVIDIETIKIVRELWGHTNRITDLVFSYDGRWIISSSSDLTIRTWDLPVGCLIDAFRTPSICTSLDFSPTGDFLATTHIDSYGITLWTNKSQFSEVFVRSIQESEIKTINLPAVLEENSSGMIDFSLKNIPNDTDIFYKAEYTSSKQINQMLTLSSIPRFKLNTLYNLDIIKLRNKPKEPPKAPKNAPFFMTLLKDTSKDTIPSISYTNESLETDKRVSRIINMKDLSVESQFTKLLKQGAAQKDYTKFISHLKTLNPSSIDFEIRSLSLDSLFSEIIWFLDALTQSLKRRIDFEFIQICMAKFLNIHGDIFIENPNNDALQQSLVNWEKEHKIISIKLKKLVDYCSGVLSFIRN